MRFRSVVVVAAFVLGLVAASAAVAQEGVGATEPENLLEWDDSPAGFLMTKDEKKEWKKITTEDQARDFIDLFWARRNPDPTSSFNPFKADFENRVRYADEQYTSERGRGALSDRGRVLILMGPPHYSENRFPTETVERIEDRAVGTDEVRSNAKLWFYDPQQLPDGFGIKGSRLIFTFYEEKAESNYFVLDRSHQEATMAMRALSKAPEVYVLHPKLKEVPKPVSVPGGEAPTDAQLAWLDAGPAPFDDARRVVEKVAVADAANRPLWLHLELPENAPTLDTLAGLVRDAEGAVASTFQVAAEPLDTAFGTAYQLTFPLSPGSYTVEVAGAAGGSPQVTWSDDVTIPATPLEGTWMTPITLGLSFVQDDDWKLGYPFAYGSLHVLPLTATSVTSKDELSYFGHVIRPGLNEAGEPELEVAVTFKMDGKPLARPFKMKLGAAKIADDLYAYANGINLGALTQTGTYGIEFEVTDTIADVSVSREVELEVEVE